MSVFKFTPAVILAAAGSYASAADATLITQTYNLALSDLQEGDDSLKTPIVVGSGDVGGYGQFLMVDYAPSEMEPEVARTMFAAEQSAFGPLSDTEAMPANEDSLTQFFIKVTPPTGNERYAQLVFDLGGQRTLGYATFGADSTLRSITYDDGLESDVPEPAVWMELIAGFGLAGGAMRASRRQRQPAMAR